MPCKYAASLPGVQRPAHSITVFHVLFFFAVIFTFISSAEDALVVRVESGRGTTTDEEQHQESDHAGAHAAAVVVIGVVIVASHAILQGGPDLHLPILN